jgi:hypothetical protein
MDGIKQLFDLQGVGAGYISDQLEYIHFSDVAYLSALSACSYDLGNEITINQANIEQGVTSWVRFIPEKSSLNYYAQSFAITIFTSTSTSTSTSTKIETSTSTSTKTKRSNNVNEFSLVRGVYSNLEAVLETNVKGFFEDFFKDNLVVKKSSKVQGYQYQGVPCSWCSISFEGLDTGYCSFYIELITSENFSLEHTLFERTLFGRISHECTLGEQLLSIPYLAYKKRSVKVILLFVQKKLLTYHYRLLALKSQLYRSNSEANLGVNDRNNLVR